MDLVASNCANGTISVLLGNGNGTFRAAVSYIIGSCAYGVAIGDLNGDTYLDVAAVGTSFNYFIIFLGDGAGSFFEWWSFVIDYNPTSLALYDFNNDGRLDVVTAHYTGTVSVFLNTC
ncbi:unnamed protein product [Rotaria sp. Silwood2]|nr:unnamed protein product [Rotaria sp. Silwood2]